MKKICLSIVMTLVSFYAFSIDVNTAKKVARSFFNQPDTRSEMVEPVLLWDGLWDTRSDDCTRPPFYVFGSENGGYVVVAGYEAAYPVLGFSRTASFDKNNLSPGEEYLFDWMSVVVAKARENGVMPTSGVSAEWDMYLSGEMRSDGSEVVLETADWNQSDPYNRLCPILSGRRCLTGCVNTATAIIMRYHKWPQSGSGYLPSYMLCGRDFGGHQLGHIYDWDNMLLNYEREEYSDYQANQVAQIMYDVGVMNESDYGPDETPSNLNYERLVEYFDYDPGILPLTRTGFSDAEWETLIKNEIDSGRPVYYTGRPVLASTGHALLIDGYSGRYFSMNLGWGGKDNRFYTLTLIDGMEDDMPYYSQTQTVVVNIKPNEGGKPSCFLTKTNYIYIDDWNYMPGEPFHLNKFVVQKRGLLDVYCCDLAYGVVDKDGHIKEIISSPVRAEIKKSFSSDDNVLCVVTSDLSADDTIRLCYRDMETNVWAVMHSSPEGILGMVHDSPLHSLCSINYSKYEDRDSGEYRELEIGVPIGVCRRFYDEDGVMIPVEDGYLVSDEFQVSLKRSSRLLTLRKKRGDGYHRITIQVYDMVDEYSFDVIF